MKHAYFIHKGMKTMTVFSKALALTIAKNQQAEIYRLSYGYYKDCDFCMDWPTVYTAAVKIFPVNN
jgi:hypothetical protein